MACTIAHAEENWHVSSFGFLKCLIAPWIPVHLVSAESCEPDTDCLDTTYQYIVSYPCSIDLHSGSDGLVLYHMLMPMLSLGHHSHTAAANAYRVVGVLSQIGRRVISRQTVCVLGLLGRSGRCSVHRSGSHDANWAAAHQPCATRAASRWYSMLLMMIPGDPRDRPERT